MPAGHILMRPEQLLDTNAYYAVELDGHLYTPTYFDVTDLIALGQSQNGRYNNSLTYLI